MSQNSWPAALYNLGSGNWLAWASGAAAHYVAIHCPRKRTIGPTVQLADTIALISHTRPSPHSHSYYSFPVPLTVGGWVGLATHRLATCSRLPAVDQVWVEPTTSLLKCPILYQLDHCTHIMNYAQGQLCCSNSELLLHPSHSLDCVETAQSSCFSEEGLRLTNSTLCYKGFQVWAQFVLV